MNSAAILCRGPSIRENWPSAKTYDLVVAVNCAINEYDADYLVAADPGSYRYFSGRPRVGCIYRADLLQKGDIEPPLVYGWPVEWEDATPWAAETSFSVEVAIGLAIRKGFKTIDLYGCDLEPTTDARPSIASPGRQLLESKVRFVDELRALQKLKQLKEYTINRIPQEVKL